MRSTLLCAGLLTSLTLAGCGGQQGAQPSAVAPQRMRQAAATVSSAATGTVIFNGLRANYTISVTADGYLVTDTTNSEPPRTVAATARLRFSDQSVMFDAAGVPGQTFRLYQAAFNRAPDQGGLGYWMGIMDRGLSLQQVAASFVASAEFKTLYGANPTNADIVTRFYNNVLHRAPDPDGFKFWVNLLDTHAADAAGVLAGFSESKENQDATVGTIQSGVSYLESGVSYPDTTHTFLLRSAYHQRINTPGTDYLTISGSCAGYASYTYTAPVSSSFEGATALMAQTAVSLGLTTCSPSSLDWTDNDYFDSNDNLLGRAEPGSDYDVTTSAQRSLPQVAKVGDSGTLATLAIYADSSKQGAPGQTVLSYSVDADGTSSTSAIFKLSWASSDAAGKLFYTHSVSYRIGTDGSLTTLGMDDAYASGIHLVYTASPASAQPAKLTVIDTLAGTGATAAAGQTLTVNYTGWLYDPSAPNFKGKQFDTSTGGDHFSFTVGAGEVFAGCDQGLVGITGGGKRTLLIPSILGYRTTGAGASIPGNAALVFDVELVSVK